MPGGDQTGPLGEGSMTGRRMGVCAGLETAGYVRRFAGRGFSSGRGRCGFKSGFGNQQVTSSVSQLDLLKNELDQINQRIDTLVSNLK